MKRDGVPVHPRACGERESLPSHPEARSVHPRACGEHSARHRIRFNRWRFIPARAGNTALFIVAVHRSRFIPARAGNAPVIACRAVQSVHPRACGEHLDQSQVIGALAGSSPRVRGTHRRATATTLPVRFIPARAGNHFTEPPRRPTRFIPARAGNACCKTICQIARFIPARAGNTSSVSGFHLATGSSPRVRGTRPYHQPDSIRRGSSPRVRGTPHRGFHLVQPVHPRACGERGRGVRPLPSGSSPRVRGTQFARQRPLPDPVHPRACGERQARIARSHNSRFIPRVRGTLFV